MIKVLIVEDSMVIRELLLHILGSEPGIEVIGTVSTGEEALEFLSKQKPDVITMDICMPGMGGLRATRKIMETNPVPIVIVSAHWNPDEVKTTFLAIDAGAVAILEKPAYLGLPVYEEMAKKIVQTVKLMSEVKVLRRKDLHGKTKTTSLSSPEYIPGDRKIKLIAIGASTGGPFAIKTILSTLSRDFPVPLLIVQHITAGFLEGLVKWLEETSRMPVHIAKHSEYIQPGHVYFAPDGFHMGVLENFQIILSKGAEENFLRPSISYLFRSVANACGMDAMGILLTGMGKDGSHDLLFMKEKGAITIAQDKESSVVHGMPGHAIKLGAADYVLPLDRIVEFIVSSVNRKDL